MIDHDAGEGVALDVAGANLDAAWQAGVGLDVALADCRRARLALGSDPLIEDAKMVLAEQFSCSPSAAYDLLLWNAPGGRLGEFAHHFMAGTATVSLPDD